MALLLCMRSFDVFSSMNAANHMSQIARTAEYAAVSITEAITLQAPLKSF
jgi:hypothetical protein